MLKWLTVWEERGDLTPLGVLFLRLVLAAYWGVHWEYKVFHDGMKATEHVFTSLGFGAGWLGAT
jgi:putative oxidoreductase